MTVIGAQNGTLTMTSDRAKKQGGNIDNDWGTKQHGNINNNWGTKQHDNNDDLKQQDNDDNDWGQYTHTTENLWNCRSTNYHDYAVSKMEVIDTTVLQSLLS